MPTHVEKQGDEYVIKDPDGKVKGRSKSKRKAHVSSAIRNREYEKKQAQEAAHVADFPSYFFDREFGDRGTLGQWNPSRHPRGRHGRFIDVLRSLRSQPRHGIDGVSLPSGHTVTFKRGAYRVHDRSGKVVAHGVTAEEVRRKLVAQRIEPDVQTPRLRVDSSRVLAKASPGTLRDVGRGGPRPGAVPRQRDRRPPTVPGTRMQVSPPTDRPGPGHVWQPGQRFVGPDGREGRVVSARFAFRPSTGPPADAAYKVRYAGFYTGDRGGFGELKSGEMRFHPDDVAAKQGEYEKLIEKIGKLPKRTPASTAKFPSGVALPGTVPHSWAVEHGYAKESERYFSMGHGASTYEANSPREITDLGARNGINPDEILFHFLTGKKPPPYDPEKAPQYGYKGGKNKAERERLIRMLTEAVYLLQQARDTATILRARARVQHYRSRLAEVQLGK